MGRRKVCCFQFNATIYSYTITNNKVVVCCVEEKLEIICGSIAMRKKTAKQIGQMKTILSIRDRVSCSPIHAVGKLMTVIS